MSTEKLKMFADILRKHKLPYNALQQFLTTMRKAKERVDAIAELNEGNNYRAEVLLDKSEDDIKRDYPLTYSVVAHLLNEAIKEGTDLDLSTISLVKNEILLKGQFGKISKVLAKQAEKHGSVLKYCEGELGLKTKDQFLPKLGDVVKSGRKLIISSNFMDFVMASNNCSFTSCHKIGSDHFNGNLAYALDDFTLIAFTAKSEAKLDDLQIYKHGRGWIYMKDKSIVQPKSYGSYLGYERELTRLYLTERLAKYYNVDNDFVLHHGQKVNVNYRSAKDVYGDNTMYVDNYGLDVTVHKSDKLSDIDLLFSSAMCLECGITTTYRQGGTCTKHYGKIMGTCGICNTRQPNDNLITIGGELMCLTCAEKTHKKCRHCGEWHRKEDLTVVGTKSVCKPCLDRHYRTCACCGEFKEAKGFADLEGVGSVCNQCVAKYMRCSICKQYHPIDNVAYHKYVGRVCTGCLDEVAFKCEQCGEFFLLKNKVEGTLTCVACDATANGKEIPKDLKPRYADLPPGWEDFTEEVG